MPILYSGTGNYYEMVLADGIDWASADVASAGSTFMGIVGHLATIMDLGEDTFINQLVDTTIGVSSSGFSNSEAWVGGFQDGVFIEPTGGWTWVNGGGAIDEFNSDPGYANWLPHEPNDFSGTGSENWLAVHLNGAFGWNDEGNLGGIAGYVVEYEYETGSPTDSGIVSLREPGTLLLLVIGFTLVVILRRRKSI